MGLMTAGCENASQVDGVTWNQNSETLADPTAPGSTGDMASYGSFNWAYGGFKGSGASHSGVTISNLRMNGMNLTFNYDTDLSAWGFSSGQIGALACFFVKNSAGQWVGGKFDWISSSRTHRGLAHCNHYEGWTLNGIPNPTEAAFVIVHPDGKRRSNVLTSPWSR